MKQIPALDGVRGLAILLVVVSHFAPTLGYHRFSGVQSLLANASMLGSTGVDLFFVLSGFLITRILRHSAPTWRNFVSFYGRRTLRIFPLYYATLLVMLWFFTAHGAQTPFMQRAPWLFSYTTNVLIALRAGWSFRILGVSLDHFWSLAVEEQFYLIWPALVFLFNRKWLTRVCWLFIAFAFSCRVYFTLGIGDQFAAMVMLPARMDAFAVGGLLALVNEDDSAQLTTMIRPLAIAGSLGLLLSCFDSRAFIILGYSSCSSLYAALLVTALYGAGRGVFTANWLRSLGKYSYAIYVLHQILAPWLRLWFPPERFGAWPFVLIGLVCCYLAAVVSYHVLERHFLHLRRFFPMQAAEPNAQT